MASGSASSGSSRERPGARRVWGSASQRIDPADALETRKVVVAGTELGAVFDRQRGEVRVVGQVAGGAEWHEQVAHVAGVPLARVNNGCHGRVEPAVDVFEGSVGRKGIAEGGGVGRDTEK